MSPRAAPSSAWLGKKITLKQRSNCIGLLSDEISVLEQSLHSQVSFGNDAASTQEERLIASSRSLFEPSRDQVMGKATDELSDEGGVQCLPNHGDCRNEGIGEDSLWLFFLLIENVVLCLCLFLVWHACDFLPN